MDSFSLYLSDTSLNKGDMNQQPIFVHPRRLLEMGLNIFVPGRWALPDVGKRTLVPVAVESPVVLLSAGPRRLYRVSSRSA